MLNFALLVSLLTATTTTVVRPAIHVDADGTYDGTGVGEPSGEAGNATTEASEPTCEPGEIEVGSLDNGDGDCSIVSYVGFTADCRVYTRAELVCVDVMFEDIVD